MQTQSFKARLMQALKWCEIHARAILMGAGVVIVLGGGSFWFQHHRYEQLTAASDLLYHAQEFYDTQFEQIRSEVKRQPAETLPQSFLELEKKYLAVIQKFPKTAQAQIAALDLSKAYLDLGQVEQAQKIISLVEYAPALKPLATLRQAFFAEMQEDYAGSKKLWQHVLSDKKQGKSFHGLAKVHLARIEYFLKNPEGGKALLEEVIKDYPDKFEAIEAEKVKLFYE